MNNTNTGTKKRVQRPDLFISKFQKTEENSLFNSNTSTSHPSLSNITSQSNSIGAEQANSSNSNIGYNEKSPSSNKTSGKQSVQENSKDLSSLDFSKMLPLLPIPDFPITTHYAPNERIEIISKISEDTVLYFDKEENTTNVLNDYQALHNFIANCKPLNRGHRVKAKSAYHIQVEGYARTGKTTLATIILPYLLSKKYTLYSHFRTLTIDCQMVGDCDFHSFLYSFVIEALNLDSTKVEKLFSKDVTFWPRFWKDILDRDTLYFICLDELQSLSEDQLTEAKYCLKQGGNPDNILPIFTGSSQALFLSRVASVRANGFSLKESLHTYVIPKETSVQKIQDTITGLNTIAKATKFTMETIQELRIVFRDVLPAHLTILLNGSKVSDLIGAYENIYYRDFKLLSQKELSLREQQVIQFLLEDNFKKLGVKTIPSELGYFFEETTQRDTYKLRDVILDEMVHFHFKIEGEVVFKRDTCTETKDYYQDFFQLLPLFEFGETRNENKNKYLKNPSFIPTKNQIETLFKELVKETDGLIKNQTKSFHGILIEARHHVFHNIPRASATLKLFLDHWFDQSKAKLHSFLVELIAINEENYKILQKY